MGGGYVSELRRPLEHRVQPPSLTERETEVQKEGRTGPLLHSTWVSEEKRPGNPSEMPASRLSKSCADTSNCLGPLGPCLLPKTPTHISVTTGTSIPISGREPSWASITNSSHKQVHTWVQACTHTPVCVCGEAGPSLSSPQGPRLPPVLGWGAGGSSEG